MISGFRRCVNEIVTLLGYFATLIGSCHPIFKGKDEVLDP
jgi:hypothetical protein